MNSLRCGLCTLIVGSAIVAAPVPMSSKVPEEEPSPSAIQLLRLRKVQKELKLSAEQRIAIVDGMGDIDEAVDKKLQALFKVTNPQMEVHLDLFRNLKNEHQKSRDKFLKTSSANLLTAMQRTRLRQIDRQLRGPAAFSDPGLDKLLSLKEEQQEAIRDAVEHFNQKTEDYIAAVRIDRHTFEAVGVLLKTRKESLNKLTALLTADQKEVWNGLIGEPVNSFDLLDLWFSMMEEDEDGPVEGRR